MDFNLSLEKSSFLDEVFFSSASNKRTKFSGPLVTLLCDEFIETSQDFDRTPIQESWSWRNTHIARELSKLLINEKGELNTEILEKSIEILQSNLFSLGKERHHDARRQKHLLGILRLFKNDIELISALKQISKPIRNRGAERLIRETLFLKQKDLLTDAHARMAALSALLTTLRQNVGSCFATAPAILIQQEQPVKFLNDISQLLAIGSLKRTFEGIEYQAPLSFSWGVGDLYKPFLSIQLGKKPWKTLSSSPGILAALKAADIYHKEESDFRVKCEALLKASFEQINLDEPFLFLDANQIIKRSLLYYYELTEEDIEGYENGSLSGIASEIVIQAPPLSGGKSQACKRYLNSFEQAVAAFKSITDNALLKAWEFTLASLSESKADFARWNLYSSLGLNPEEPNGIGRAIHAKVQEKIEGFNREIEDIQSQYDHVFAQVKSLEGRIQRAATEGEVNWIRAEYKMRRHELDRIVNLRDEIYEKGQKLSQLFPFLHKFYGEKFREYFQEVYDAQMHDISTNPYDDSPAGFRLLYKHGRSNPSLWTLIYTHQEYIQALSSFFKATEIELTNYPETSGLQEELSDLITTVLTTIKTDEFLESSIYRLAYAYNEPVLKKPLQNLEKIGRKPWVYISGGTMETLISCYYGNSRKPKEAKRWVENPTELLVFFLDTLKELPLSTQKLFENTQERSMLSFSPTHAYLLKPGWMPFREGWDNKAFTYNWVRDHWISPQQSFIYEILLDQRMTEYLKEKILQVIPEGYRSIASQVLDRQNRSIRPTEFRQNILTRLSYERWLQGGNRLELLSEEIDSILFSSLPLFPDHQLRERLETLFTFTDNITPQIYKRIFKIFDELEHTFGRYKVYSAKDLREIAKGLLVLALKNTRSPFPFHQDITAGMQKSGLSLPSPILFADTNWVNNYFGFVVNPGTEELELWRLDDCGSEGKPMRIWKRFLNGSDKKDWGFYYAPHEYGQFL